MTGRRVAIGLAALTAVVVAGGAYWLIDGEKTVQGGQRIYYVSAGGDDRADGRTKSRAWQTLDRVSAQGLLPGDKVLLEGGASFSGQLTLTSEDAGDPMRPVEIGAYGEGRAVLEPGDRSALFVHNTAGVVVRDLRIVGGPGTTAVDGVNVYNDLGGDARLKSVTVENVEVSGFQNGIAIGAGESSPGFEDVTVRDSAFHGNRLAGLVTYGTRFDSDAPVYANANVTVSSVDAYGNTGDRDTEGNSGSGIVLGSVDTGRVEKSTAHGNGELSAAVEGPIGIWAYDATNLVIEENLAYGNRTSGADGGGLGLDLAVSDSVVQHNLTYDNDGSGVLLFASPANRAFARNVVRFNISVDDGRRGDFHGGITVLGGLAGGDPAGGVIDTEIYRNTVVMGAGTGDWLPPAISVGGALHGVRVQNNNLVTDGGAPALRSTESTPGGVTFTGNNYSGDSTAPVILWEESSYWLLIGWRDDAGQELVAGKPVGVEVSPEFADTALARGGPAARAKVLAQITAADQIRTATAFRLQPDSPLIGAGVPLHEIDPGPRDYYDVPLETGRTGVGAAATGGRNP